MTIDTKTMVSISDANQNFSKVARLVDECGSAVILKNNVPRYLVIDFSKADMWWKLCICFLCCNLADLKK